MSAVIVVAYVGLIAAPTLTRASSPASSERAGEAARTREALGTRVGHEIVPVVARPARGGA